METVILKDSVTSRMTDDEFFRFCIENSDLRIERNNHLEIVIMSPTSSLSGFYSMEVARQLANWAILSGTGVAFDSSAGFTLPDHSMMSPDASWISREKWNNLSDEDKSKFAPVCPQLVIEVRSKSDSLHSLKMKMQNWIDNGAEFAWLIDPIEKNAYIYNPNTAEQKLEGFDRKVKGEGLIAGFELDLSYLLKI